MSVCEDFTWENGENSMAHFGHMCGMIYNKFIQLFVKEEWSFYKLGAIIQIKVGMLNVFLLCILTV